MVNPCPIFSFIRLYQACSKFKSYSSLLVLGLYHPQNNWYNQWHHVLVTNKYNNSHAFWIMDSSYCHWSYWLSYNNKHANDPNPFHVYAPCLWPVGCVNHVVFPMLWDGRLKTELFILVLVKCGPTLHFLLATITVIKHCEWYMCWQVPKSHVPFCPNG
jgi:hypothetical protein